MKEGRSEIGQCGTQEVRNGDQPIGNGELRKAETEVSRLPMGTQEVRNGVRIGVEIRISDGGTQDGET